MRLLLDTHTLIWFGNGDKNLSSKAESLIADGANQIYFSVISSFEMAIKINIGKLQLSRSLIGFLQNAAEKSIEPLPLKESHLNQYLTLPLFSDHRDPFDWMIIATAIAGSLTIITTDQKFSLYKNLVAVEW